MTDLRTAAQRALAYMDSVGKDDMYPEEWAVAESLRAALAQQAEPQPEPRADVYRRGYEEGLNDALRNGLRWAREYFNDAAPPAVQHAEPVAWMVYTLDGKSVCVTDNPKDFTEQHRALPLYTAPPPRKPLTEEEIDELSRSMVKGNKSVNWLCRAIERTHGIGGQDGQA